MAHIVNLCHISTTHVCPLSRVFPHLAISHKGQLVVKREYNSQRTTEPEDFNACAIDHFPTHRFGHKYDLALRETLIHTPMPGLAEGAGTLPRFRSETGTFIGLAGSIDSRIIDGGFLESQVEID